MLTAARMPSALGLVTLPASTWGRDMELLPLAMFVIGATVLAFLLDGIFLKGKQK